jgi:hypothetical protein
VNARTVFTLVDVLILKEEVKASEDNVTIHLQFVRHALHVNRHKNLGGSRALAFLCERGKCRVVALIDCLKNLSVCKSTWTKQLFRRLSLELRGYSLAIVRRPSEAALGPLDR